MNHGPLPYQGTLVVLWTGLPLLLTCGLLSVDVHQRPPLSRAVVTQLVTRLPSGSASSAWWSSPSTGGAGGNPLSRLRKTQRSEEAASTPSVGARGGSPACAMMLLGRMHHFISPFRCAMKCFLDHTRLLAARSRQEMGGLCPVRRTRRRSALDGALPQISLCRRVRGGVPPHPLASAERLLLNFAADGIALVLLVVRVLGRVLPSPSGDCPAAYRRAWLACSRVRWCGCHLRTAPGTPTARPAAAPSRSGGSASEPRRARRESSPQVARSKSGRAFHGCPGRALPLNTTPANAYATHAEGCRSPHLGRFPFSRPARLDRWRWPMPAPSFLSLAPWPVSAWP